MKNKEDVNNIWDNAWDSAVVSSEDSTGKFRRKPVPAEEFAEHWVKQPLFEDQIDIVRAAFNKDYTDISENFNEFVIGFGKGSGKDLTIALLIDYMIYWLTCLHSPHDYLGVPEGENLDIVNIALDGEQANSVFFDKFKRFVDRTIDPETGENYFEGLGMDLEKAVLKKSIIFPFNIRAWSSNSREEKSEGKNIILAIFDEIGGFRFDKAKSIRDHVKSSAKTRFPKLFKMFYISFLRDPNDYMSYLLEQAEEGVMQKTYHVRKATWQVRNKDTKIEALKRYAAYKEDFQDEYDEDELEAILKYECKIPKVRRDNFIRNPQKILSCIGGYRNNLGDFIYRPSPVIEPKDFWSYNPLNEEYEAWFKPFYTYNIWRLEKLYMQNPTEALEDAIRIERERHRAAEYFIHLDLSKGVVDCAGLILGHSYTVLDSKKLYIDLALQIRAEKTNEDNQEIDTTQILDFVIKYLYKEKKFPIKLLTADGYQSALFFDLCKKERIDCKELSLVRTNEPYETSKDLIYREDIDYYYYPPLIRELTELIKDEKGKIDHPRRSKWRMKEEGIPTGSKDLSDCLAGISHSVINEGSNKQLTFGSNLKKKPKIRGRD